MCRLATLGDIETVIGAGSGRTAKAARPVFVGSVLLLTVISINLVEAIPWGAV
jgi:hypothetical protein